MTRLPLVSALVVALSLGAAACGGGAGSDPAAELVDLHGAGASFPAPLYDKWFKAYVAAHPNVRIDYQSLGSGAGVNAVHEQDGGLRRERRRDDRRGNVESREGRAAAADDGGRGRARVQPAGPQDRRCGSHARPTRASSSARSRSGMTRRSRRPIPARSFPATNITVVHRADASGTTFVFTQHLSAISDAWKTGPGTSKSAELADRRRRQGQRRRHVVHQADGRRHRLHRVRLREADEHAVGTAREQEWRVRRGEHHVEPGRARRDAAAGQPARLRGGSRGRRRRIRSSPTRGCCSTSRTTSRRIRRR